MNINSQTKIICLLGHPVKHSFSPIMHNYLFNKYNINYVYTCFDVDEGQLNESIQGIKSLGIKGMNVTIPYKVDIIKYLGTVDKNSNLIGAVNTVINKNGILEGYNTDGKGFVKSIINQNHKLKDKNIMILGAGGACRSIAVELASENVKSIQIRNRSIKKAEEITKIITSNFDIKISYCTDKVKQCDLDEIDILINTTPIGMESDECPIDEAIKLKNNILVCDIVYKPHNTAFLTWAKKQGMNVVYGIDMLINQGLEAFYIWTNIKPNKTDEKEIRELYKQYIK